MRFFALSAVLFAAASVSAQSDAARTAFGLWHEGSALGSTPGLLCGGGPDYRVEFRPGGASYVPALPDAPRLYPVRFSFHALERGTDVLAVGRPVTPGSSDGAAFYDRGRDLVERYQLGSDGVKQSFVLARRPVGRGDLVVRQRLVTDLSPEKAGDCSTGLRFVAPNGHGSVELGEAVAIDAGGARFAMTMSFDGTWLELRLDHAAVEAAAYPLVLDPPIGTGRSLTATDDRAPDVAWNEPTRRYLVVWHVSISSSDTQVFGQLLDERAMAVSPMLPISSRNRVAMFPTVASYGIQDQFCVVWQEAATLLGTYNLESRLVEASSGALSSIVQVPTTSGGNSLAPDLAGTPGRGDNRITLVYQSTTAGIWAFGGRVSSLGDPEWILPTNLAVGANLARPAIAKSSGGSDVHVVAWDAASPATGTSIQAIAISGTGAPLSSTVTVSSALTMRSPRRRAPDVDGDGERFLVVYELEESTGAGLYDVYCRPLTWDGSTLTATAAAAPVEKDAGRDESDPAVGYLSGLFLVAVADDDGEMFTYDVVLLTLDADGTPCGARFQLRNGAAHDLDPALATQSGVGRGDEALCVSYQDGVHPLLPSGLGVQLFEAYTSGSAISLGGACGNGGTAVANGVFAAGNVTFRLELQGTDPSAFSAVLLLGGPGPALSCGSCAIVNPAISIGLPVSGGAAGFALPLPCSLQSAAGAVMEAQWLTLGTSLSPCPLLGGFSFSDRLQLTLGQ